MSARGMIADRPSNALESGSMNAQKASSKSDQLIKSLAGQFEKLLAENWIDLWAYRNGEQAAKGSVTFSIQPAGDNFTVAASIRYGIRLKKDSRQKVLMNHDDH